MQISELTVGHSGHQIQGNSVQKRAQLESGMGHAPPLFFLPSGFSWSSGENKT